MAASKYECRPCLCGALVHHASCPCVHIIEIICHNVDADGANASPGDAQTDEGFSLAKKLTCPRAVPQNGMLITIIKIFTLLTSSLVYSGHLTTIVSPSQALQVRFSQVLIFCTFFPEFVSSEVILIHVSFSNIQVD